MPKSYRDQKEEIKVLSGVFAIVFVVTAILLFIHPALVAVAGIAWYLWTDRQ